MLSRRFCEELVELDLELALELLLLLEELELYLSLAGEVFQV